MSLQQSPSHSRISGADARGVSKPWQRGFWSLFAVQFQGALSDNTFKFIVLFTITDAVATSGERDQYITLIAAIFSLPFLLFSMAGGYLADRYPKRKIVIGTKWMEIGVMLVGTLALFLGSLPLLLVVIFLMSTQSTFFSPAKYGSMPEILPEDRLSWGNGILSFGTFVAIITGGIVGGVLYKSFAGQPLVWGGFLVALAAIGLVLAHGMKNISSANPEKVFRWNFLVDLGMNLGKVRRDRVLLLAVLGSTYFWFLGALFGDPTLFVYNEELLHLDEDQYGMLRACLAIGIAIGSILAGIVSGRKIEYGLVPLGAFGLAAMACLLAIPGLSVQAVAAILALLGISGGFYIVPLAAIVQHLPAAKDKGSIVATNGWMTSLGVFLAAGAFWLLKTALGLSPPQIFLVGGILTFAATIYAIRLMPDALMRFFIWALTHTFYRVRVVNRENIPEKGGALFVSNHLSLADACFLIASTDRQIRFLMDEKIYRRWWIHPFARMLRTIPISSELRPRAILKALGEAARWIAAGNVVCLFAEGQVTRTGQMLPFRKGMTRIMKGLGSDVSIIPVHLDNVWGSLFSFERGRFGWKRPHRIPYPVTVSYGAPLVASASPGEVRRAVQDLGVEAWELRKPRMRTLGRAFIRTARKHRSRFAVTDATSPRLSFHGVLTRAIFLGRRLRSEWEGEERVGIMLPPCVPGALANYAAWIMGKVPVNLNYTLSGEALASCIARCGLTSVVTSKQFLEHLKFDLPVPTVLIEEVAKTPAPKRTEKLFAALAAWCLPARLIERALGAHDRPRIDDLATIIFSSGSTGDPKGIMLSHYNIVSNAHQFNQVFAFRKDDAVLGALPFFHSFGFTATLGVPAVLGVGVGYLPNPLDARGAGALVSENRLTFLLGTPTFLQVYLRGCRPEQFASLRFVMAGGEKLPQRLAQAFEKRFGLRPMEGYGATECAPGIAVNTRSYALGARIQVGAREGTIGQALPGMAVRIVDPETREPLPTGEAGLLLVKGPNVMRGYWERPDLTDEAMHEGWYITGDIVTMDEDGFLTVTDRLSRFSKIGGEMVPHLRVEESLHQAAGVTEQTFAVTGLPDAKKGEQLAVLHTLDAARLEETLASFSQTDLPNLWKPKRQQFFHVAALPVLGTGKLDLRGVKERAQKASQPAGDPGRAGAAPGAQT